MTRLTADTIQDLLPLLTDDWYNSVEGSYSNVPTWGPKTEAVQDQINRSCDEGDIVSWDTRDSDSGRHLYLRREWDPAHVHGPQENRFEIVSGAEYLPE